MNKFLAAFLVSGLASSAFAFELPSMKVAGIAAGPAEIPAPVSAPAKADKQYQSVFMSLRTNPSWKEAEANDFSAGISARVRKNSGSFYSANLSVNNSYEFVNLSKFGDGFTLTGSGISLDMRPWGNGYMVTGTVSGPKGYTSVYATLNTNEYYGAKYFYISDRGLTLTFNPGSVSGSYEDGNYSPKACAAVVALALAGHIESLPDQKAAPAQGERVWLTFRNNGNFGWNAMEASDPFADIEVGIRKIFDKEYDADIDVANSRETGRVSNFFSDRWEYRGRGGDLSLRQWGGMNDLEGQVYGADGKPVQVRMRANVNFGFVSVNENGLRLNADRNGVNAEIDTKVYPKSLVAYIAAIVMSMQHSALNQNQPY